MIARGPATGGVAAAGATNDHFDYIIVGGGTAGCVMAARLSERSGNRVLLVEAGIDTPPLTTPHDINDPYPLSYGNPDYRWALTGHALTAATSAAAPLLQARVMGGGSSIMGMIMLRGLPADYDGWAAAGASGWAWRDVLPIFRRLENDTDFGGDLHSNEGPTTIRRHAVATWPPAALAAGDYARQQGIEFIADMNGDFRDGYGALPIAGTPDRRATSASAYLTAAVRQRPNLSIMANTRLRGLIWDGMRCAGVQLKRDDGSMTHVRSGQVLLSMGALLTPHALLCAGIGDGEELRQAGVAVRSHLPGVGRNLQNHASLTIAAHLRRAGRQARPQRNHNNSMFRFSSRVDGATTADMALVLGSRVTWHAMAARIAHLSPLIMAPFSRGRVTISGADRNKPLVEYDLLGDPRDAQRLHDALDFVADLHAFLARRAIMGPAAPVTRMGNAARFAAQTRFNSAMTRMLAGVSDALPILGDLMLGTLTDDGMSWADVMGSADVRADFVRRHAMPLAHHCGTCRIGASSDPLAVTDAAGSVHGVEGLRVVDASLMPFVPRANTNLPTLMVAEKLADAILAGD